MDEQQQVTSEGEQASRSSRNPSSGGSRSGAVGSPPPSSSRFVINSEEVGRPVAEQLLAPACSPVSGTRDVWGVLTAISDKAKSRSQGPQILLHNSEHVLGRLVKDPSCQFDSLNVSAKHCTIFRKRFKAEGCIPLRGTELVSGDRWLVYIKDSSSNGTFINCQKLKRDSPEARIKDGDIISLVNAPEHENAFAFLYQEIKPNALNVSTHQPNGSVSCALKRKSLYEGEIVGESNSGDSKRVKGLGIGGLDGPVSLDDVRRLQRSNEELRNQLEAHLLTIEKLRAESRAAVARHDAEIKEIRETLSAAFLDQIQDLRTELGKKEKELDTSTSLCVQQQSRLEDRNRSLAAAIQSRKDADEVIKSQKLNIVELKEQLEDEHSQRRSERGKAEADLKAALERVRSEALEELKRQSESSAQQLREHLEMINKLQEADRESRSLIEALRTKLEDTRETLVKAERTSRSLELRLQDEEASLAMAIKRITEKEQELQCTTKEMQNEKTAKEEALARLSTVEVEMETAIHDLSVEQQRLQGARERIVLRETQLRAFHSTAEEVALLQQKQQEQLKEMMRVLEDGEDECHMPARDHYNGNTTTQTRVEVDTQTREEDNNALQGSEQRMDNHTVNNDEEKEVAGDADSQTTASSFSAHAEPNKVFIEEYGDGDTQVDDSNEFVDASRNAQAVLFPDDEQKGSKPSVRMGTEAGYTQVLEIESNYRYMNETQVLGNGRDEGVQTKVFAGYTQLLDTQSKLGSGKYLNETQLLDNGRDENISIKGRKDGGGNTEFRGTDEQARVPGGETLLLEDENDTEMGEWGRRVEAQLENQETKMSGVIHESELASRPDKRGVSIEPAIEHGVQGSEACNQVDVASEKNVPATTVELITSEVAGSWAYSTPASVHCDDGGWSESQVRVGGPERGSIDAHLDYNASQLGRGIKGIHPPQQKGRLLENSHSPRTTAWHDKERRDLNVMLDIVAPELSRLHGLGRVMETAPDSEDHTGEEEEEEDDDDEVLKSHEDSAESEPHSQSVSVSARY